MKKQTTGKKPKIRHLSDSAAILDFGGQAISLSTSPRSSLDSYIFDMAADGGGNWEQTYQTVRGYKIVPYGINNDFPVMIRDIMARNNLAPGVLHRKQNLLTGQGAFLYENTFDGGKITRRWIDDPNISAWLRSWDYDRFIDQAATDYLHTGGFFAIHPLERGYRLPGHDRRIARLEFVSAKDARLEWTDSRNIDDVRHILVGDFETACVNSGLRSYPVFDPTDPGRYPISASYNYTYAFGRNFYATPGFMGAIRWILRGSDIPMIFRHVTENGLNLAYHVHSPQGYWDRIEEKLREKYPEEQPEEIEARYKQAKKKILDALTETLSGKQNAGKFFESIDSYDDDNNLITWKIEPVDQKIKDFVEAQLKISEASSSAITSGMALHPSLTNIMVNGKLASGSEMLYALKVFLHFDTRIPERVILGPINQAIAYNFPGTRYQLGFYHAVVMSEEGISESERMKNN